MLLIAPVSVFLIAAPAAALDNPPPFVRTWGSPGTGAGQFQGPEGIAADTSGNLYVADAGNDRVEKFAADGTYISQWATRHNEQLDLPSVPNSVAVGPDGVVYVSVQSSNPLGSSSWCTGVQLFSSIGTFISEWGSCGTGAPVSAYSDVDLDGASNVYVLDSYQNQIRKFTSAGTSIDAWQANDAKGIAAAPDGTVYAVGGFNPGFVEKYSTDGDLISSWDAGPVTPFGGVQPSGVTVGPSGSIFVTLSSLRTVREFDASGSLKTEFGSRGSGDGQFENPFDLAIGSSGHIHVADLSLDRIQEFGVGVTPPPPTYKFVALGDSFSSGEGIEPFLAASAGNQCHRSELAYAEFVEEPGHAGASIYSRYQAGDDGVRWGFQACSGAVTDNVLYHGYDNHDPLAQL